MGVWNAKYRQNTVTGGNLYQMMPVNAKLSLEQKMGGWTNSVEAQFVGAKKNIEQVRNEIKTSAYALLNLRSSYEWKNIRVDVGIDNLLDTLYYLPLGGAYLGQAATMSGPLPQAPHWGIAVPGMPVGSPGMEVDGLETEPFDVILFNESGRTEIYANYPD